tara:strand:+ start:755 stop:2140 length:1386 start_codon:yes stop_codon:yes gene_type:complete
MITFNNNKYISIPTNILFLFLALTILFGRSLTGVYILNFRLGELMIGFGLLVSIVLLFTPHSRSFVNVNKLNFYVHKAILLQFIIIVLITETSFTSSYTYKSSSYIWTLSFLYIGIFLTQDIKKNSWFIKVLPLLLPSLYILSTIKFPQFLMDFFINYSDKFDFVKASDLLVIYVGTNYILRVYYKNSLKDLSYFLISSAVYLPYLLFKSKGAFFPAVLFIIFNLFFYYAVFKNEKIKSLLILFFCIPVFLISTFHIYGNFNFTKEGMQNYQEIETFRPEAIQQSLGGLINEKNTGEIFYSFYILDGRLYSQDQMADWRLQIWQDISRDLFWKAEYVQGDRYQLIRYQGERRYDIFYKGFGYSQILPAMNHWERTGTDGTNENPHNFLFNSLGRGGIFQPLLIIVFHLSIFLYWYRKNKNFHILLFMLPVLMTSFFDASMESVRFPFVYYSLLSLVLNEKI